MIKITDLCCKFRSSSVTTRSGLRLEIFEATIERRIQASVEWVELICVSICARILDLKIAV